MLKSQEKYKVNKFLSIYVFLITMLIIVGCSDNKTVADEESMVSTSSHINITNKSAVQEVAAQPAKQISEEKPKLEIVDISDIFKNSNSLTPNGKYMIMLFDSVDCYYCVKLKKDILENEKLKNRIKNNFSAYALSIDENNLYQFMYNGKTVSADTNLLKSIYTISSTPTMLFSDKDAKNIFIISGYISPEKLEATLNFIEEGIWKGKDRKNGEVYKALEEYYVGKGTIKTH